MKITQSATKAEIRREMIARRNALDPEARLRAAEAAARHALALCEKSLGPVALYWPVRSELSPLILAEHLHQRRIALSLPLVAEPNEALQFRAYAPGDAMHKGRYGIDEPARTSPLRTPAILIAPLIAFDAAGHRLGTGGGFYDRTLQALRAQNADLKAYGFGFAFQQVDALPHEPHDQDLDATITEKGVVTP